MELHSKEAEQGVLGSLLTDAERCVELCYDGGVKADWFVDRSHSILYELMLEMDVKGKPLDMLTIGEYAKGKGLLERIGGYDGIEELADSTPTSAHFEYYAEILKDKYLKREVVAYGEYVSGLIRSGVGAVDIIELTQASALELGIDEVDDRTMGECCTEFIDSCENQTIGTFPWWHEEFDKIMGRLSNELVFLHAPRSTGKTAIIVQWLRRVHNLGDKAALASLESLKETIVPRFLAQEAGINTLDLKRGKEFPDDFKKAREAQARIDAMNLIVKDGSMTIEGLKVWAIAQAKRGAKAIMIDNLLCIGSLKDFDSQTKKYMYIMEQLRDLRNRINLPIIVLAHPNKDGNLAWSTDAENFADIILFLYNQDVEKSGFTGIPMRPMAHGYQHVISRFQKCRDGITPAIELEFHKYHQLFDVLRDSTMDTPYGDVCIYKY